MTWSYTVKWICVEIYQWFVCVHAWVCVCTFFHPYGCHLLFCYSMHTHALLVFFYFVVFLFVWTKCSLAQAQVVWLLSFSGCQTQEFLCLSPQYNRLLFIGWSPEKCCIKSHTFLRLECDKKNVTSEWDVNTFRGRVVFTVCWGGTEVDRGTADAFWTQGSCLLVHFTLLFLWPGPGKDSYGLAVLIGALLTLQG